MANARIDYCDLFVFVRKTNLTFRKDKADHWYKID